MTHDDLLDELRRECSSYLEWEENGDGPIVSVEIHPDEIVAFIQKRERAAAERMRERCRLAALEIHVNAMAGNTTADVARTGEIVDAIDDVAIEPEETSE